MASLTLGAAVRRLRPLRGSFQQGRCAGTTATYTPIDAEALGVYNRCYLGSLEGAVSEITGTATTMDATFTGFLVDFQFDLAAPYCPPSVTTLARAEIGCDSAVQVTRPAP